MNTPAANPTPPPFTRREWLRRSSCGFGGLALAGLMGEQTKSIASAAGPFTPRPPHFAARAKRVIFLCMRGGPSQVDTFDYKPQLQKDDGKSLGNSKLKLLGSFWKFGQHGQAGLWVTELLPHLAGMADELCVLNGMESDNPEHAQALDLLFTGSFQFARPSMGSWVTYGLGSPNQDLPGFVALSPPSILGGAKYYGSSFLPAAYQGTPIGTMGKKIRDVEIGNISHPRLPADGQRSRLDLLQSFNRDFLAKKGESAEIEGVIDSFELAFRMQSALPQVMDLTAESPATRALYGVGDGLPTDDFGRQCLLARRMAEAGVRFIQLTHDNWDHHGGLSTNMPSRCRQIDQPIAGLLTDLKQRGLLDDTLVVWGGEFGRSPDDGTGDGRGHNSKGYTMWLAGGGTKPGYRHGATDEHGFKAVEGRVHLHDLHATILHLLGLDHEQLTYPYAGRDFRLTDVHGKVVHKIIS